MTRRHKLLNLMLAAASVLFMLMPIILYAQAPEVLPSPAPGAPRTASELSVALIMLVASGSALLVTELAKKIAPMIPSAFVPIVTGALGVVADYLIASAMGSDFSPVRGAAIGGLGVLLRNFVAKLVEHGMKSVKEVKSEQVAEDIVLGKIDPA